MKKSNRVVIVTELFFPEETSTAYIMTCIADYISEYNEVLIITGPESYGIDSKILLSNRFNTNKLLIKRVPGFKLNKNRLISRGMRLITLSICLALTSILYLRRGDVLLSVTNPAPLIIFLAIIRKIKNASYILLVHDVFPENTAAIGISSDNSLIYKLIKFIFDWAYKVPDLIIAIGRDMAEIIELKVGLNRRQRIKVIENWSDLSIVKPIPRSNSRISELGLERKVVIQYAGNIGRAQGILEFVQSTRLISNDSIHFSYVGSGALFSELKQQLSRVKNASVLDAFARGSQTNVLGSCDIALVILGRNMYGLGVPSKTYNIMASGKPILFLGPRNSEIYRLVSDFDIGWTFDWENIDSMNKFINSIKFSDLPIIQNKGMKARKIAEKFYTEEIAMEKFRKVIDMVKNSQISTEEKHLLPTQNI
jgi:hypothetical protein